ncbi:MAG TPA: RagB/SusD family nutrient uptake outer membrane protein [Prolixibacteraceae bacterium]|nr:RagB/SusD family nutrient uptake outer membrane protein [Prolixibacteraceae bacterium]HPS11822.1 RagB/SusD family nutrient uptake outer membrane protein [Prolixibacteraceae bacterium]
MKKYLYKILSGFVFISLIGLTSCTDYLNRAPEAEISSTDAFINFTNFQGYTEALYCLVPEIQSRVWACDWMLADEIIHKEGGIWLNDLFDKGDYWGWTNSSWISYLDGDVNSAPSTSGSGGKPLWTNCWYGIRKANLGLENLENLTNATQEEKDFIKGQLLFFRAWFHFELMSYWGGLPYIDRTLSSNETLNFPRLSFQETADRAAEDFRAAADLLPADWEKTSTGSLTPDKNQLRITKVMALAYLGKDYLYAGSPLMNKETTGNATYNTDYCQKAAAAFAEMLKYVDRGESFVKLVNFSDYSSLFYTEGRSQIPGYPEAVFMAPVMSAWLSGCPWGASSIFTEANIGGGYTSPNARYVENYGMANGLPIDDPESGYSKTDPWANRDPRFYHDIVIDGDQVIKGSAPANKEQYRYAALYTNGASRNNQGSGRTGYLIRKLTPMIANDIDGGWDSKNYMHLSWMRLADVYLMYAEAVLQGYGSATSSVPGYITAEAAFNKVRTRCGAGTVAQKYVADKDKFMSEIIRERAVELAFEGDFRFNDLRRWMLAGELKYREKTAIDFDRGPDGKPVNVSERVLLTRPFENKHYWLPLKIDDISLYPEFKQNPGW